MGKSEIVFIYVISTNLADIDLTKEVNVEHHLCFCWHHQKSVSDLQNTYDQVHNATNCNRRKA